MLARSAQCDTVRSWVTLSGHGFHCPVGEESIIVPAHSSAFLLNICCSFHIVTLNCPVQTGAHKMAGNGKIVLKMCNRIFMNIPNGICTLNAQAENIILHQNQINFPINGEIKVLKVMFMLT